MVAMTPETLVETALPPVPLTVEGASVLHQMMRFRWRAWRALAEPRAPKSWPRPRPLGRHGAPRGWAPKRRLLAARATRAT